jgi:hypothetical protein
MGPTHKPVILNLATSFGLAVLAVLVVGNRTPKTSALDAAEALVTAGAEMAGALEGVASPVLVAEDLEVQLLLDLFEATEVVGLRAILHSAFEHPG